MVELFLVVFEKLIEVLVKKDMLFIDELRRKERNNKAVTEMAATMETVIHNLLLVLFVVRTIRGGNNGVVTVTLLAEEEELGAVALVAVGTVEVSSSIFNYSDGKVV